MRQSGAHLQLFVAVRDHAGKPDCTCVGGVSGSPPDPRVKNELAVLAAKAPRESIAMFQRELAEGGSHHPEHVAAAMSRLSGEHHAELLAHNDRVMALSPEARKEVLHSLIDEIL